MPCYTGAKFVPTPEERLLSVVHALLHRCYKLPFSNAATVTLGPLIVLVYCHRFAFPDVSLVTEHPNLALRPVTEVGSCLLEVRHTPWSS